MAHRGRSTRAAEIAARTVAPLGPIVHPSLPGGRVGLSRCVPGRRHLCGGGSSAAGGFFEHGPKPANVAVGRCSLGVWCLFRRRRSVGGVRRSLEGHCLDRAGFRSGTGGNHFGGLRFGSSRRNLVEETWSKLDDRQAEQVLSIRNIFEPIPSGIPDPALLQPDVDHFLLYLRRCWSLVPNLEDWESNLDEAGRSLGRCLWMVQGVVRAQKSNQRARLVMWAQAAHPRALSKTLLDWAKDHPGWAWEDELGTDRLSWEDAPPEVELAREVVKGDHVLHTALEELDPLTADLVDLLAKEFPIDGTRRERFDGEFFDGESFDGESFDAID